MAVNGKMALEAQALVGLPGDPDAFSPINRMACGCGREVYWSQ
jgi:hypothetical protein